MNTKIISVSKKEAQELLKNNIDNRDLKHEYISFLADQMKDGSWKFTGDTIKISKSGRILDAQHRLHAVIKSDTVQQFLVVYDLDEDIFDVLDTGRNRSSADVLHISHIKNSAKVAALCKMIIRYRTNQFAGLLDGTNVTKKSGISNKNILDFAKQNDLQAYLSFGWRMYTISKVLSITEYAFFYYIFNEISGEDAAFFLEKVASGADLRVNDPILYLRNKLVETTTTIHKLGARTRLIYVIKAWNLFRKSEDCKYFRVAINEPVPKPI